MKRYFWTLVSMCIFTSLTSAQTLTVTMKGEYSNDLFGYSVANAGNINNDSYNDLIVGAPNYNSNKGRVYIYYTGSGLDGTADVTINGQTSGEKFGISVACAGDVNKDGYKDIIVGAYTYNGHYGRAYIFFGSSTGLNTTPNVTMTGPAGAYLGYSVAGAGDVNNDGCDDVIVGAPGFSAINNFKGKAYIYYGSRTMSSNPSPNVTLQSNISQDNFGFSVAGIGDINKDNHSDVIVGAYGYGVILTPSNYWGSAYVFLGGTVTDSSADFVVYGASGKDNKLGYSVAGAGDINNDGYADFLIGAPGANANACYVYYGSRTVTNLSKSTINGPVAGGGFGFSVNRAYDINQDGFGDVVISAPSETSSTGKSYVYYGGSSIDSTPDLTMAGENVSDWFGYSVAGVGDVDGNSSLEIFIGAPYHDPNGLTNAGKSYLISGVYRELKYITLTPSTLTLTPYATKTFSAQGYDQYNDAIPNLTYVWETRIGSLSITTGSSTIFTAGTTALIGTLTVRVGTLTATATITISLGTLTCIIITPSTSTIQVNGTKSFIAKGYDKYGNFISDLSFNWATQIGSLSTTTGTSIIFYATDTTIVGVLTATYGTMTGVATISISASILTYIVITPATVTLPVNSTATFTAQGYDQYNEEMGSLTYTWISQIGSVSPVIGTSTIFTAGTSARTGTLAVTSGSVTTLATIKITSGTLSYLVIIPATATIYVGAAKSFSAQGYDEYNNPIPNLTYTWQTHIGSVSPTTGSSTIFTAADITLIGTLTATSGTMTAVSTITITGTYDDIITPLKYLIALKGNYAGEKFGISVAGNGDVNNDKYTDVVVGAPGYNSNQGRVYIYFGSAVLDDTPDLILSGGATNNNFGISVAMANVNGDAYDDVIVGAYTYNGHYGRVYVYYGGASMDANPDVTITGTAYAYLGYSVANAGDMNRDGYDDIIVGAPGFSAGNNFMGKAYIYYGGSSMDTTADAVFASGVSQDLFGYSVAGVGDMNKDGHDDVIVGAYGYGVLQPMSNYWGSAFIYLGGTVTNSTPDLMTYGAGGDLKVGYSVGAAGDINKDGYADAIVGAPGGNGNAGLIYYGSRTLGSGSPDVVINGLVPNSGFGYSVCGVGDVNKDAFDDVVMGAPVMNSYKGKFYTYYGGVPTIDTTPDIGMLGEASGDYFGYATAKGGDVNHDSAIETIISAPYNDEQGVDSGKVYIITGIPKELNYVQITPRLGTVCVDGTLTFTAQGYDIYDNPIVGLTYIWETVIGSVSTGQSITFTAGTKTITGTLGVTTNSMRDFATITITPGTLSYIIITPASVTLPFNGTQTFTAQGYDKYGNSIPNLVFSWNTKIGNLSTTTGTSVRYIAGTGAISGTISATYGTITGFATITLATTSFTYILITPATPTVEVNGTLTLTAQGYDQYGRPISGLSYTWQTNINGTLSTTSGTSTIFTASTRTLTGTIAVISNSITGFATITIAPGTISYIIINPATATLTVDGTQTFTAYGYDGYNNYIDGLRFAFSVIIGSITPTTGTNTTFMAGTTTQTATLTATFGTINQMATITIVPGTLTYIIIEPATATVAIGGTRTFTAKGYDSQNNLIENLTFIWQTFIGSISPTTGSNTLFTAGTRALIGTLSVRYDNVITNATITISVGTLNYIIITPGSATIIVEGTKTFTAQGYDTYGNLISGLTYIWFTAIGSVTPTTGTLTRFTAGSQSITGTLAVRSDSIYGFATITITTGGLHHIIITPSTATTAVNGTISFTAQGYDQFNAPLDGLTYSWHTIIGSVSPTNGTSTTFTAGTRTQTGTLAVTSGSITTMATITITPGTITSIVINPATATLQLGYTQIFTASGYDQYGNYIPNLSYNWSVTIGTISPITGGTTTFTAGMTAGVGTLTAASGTVTGRATITVTGLTHQWSMWRYDRFHKAVSSYPKPTPVVLRWTYNTSNDIYSSPAIGHDGTLYFGTIQDKKLYAVKSDGTLKWTPYTAAGEIHSSPALDSNGTIYFGSNIGYLYALNSDGTWKWQFTTGGEIYSSPVISSDGTIYFGSNDNKIYALTSNNVLIGSYTTGGDIQSSPAIGADGTVYVGSLDGKIYALSSNLSTVIGSYTTNGAIYSSPAIAGNGTVYIGSNDKKIYALSSDLSSLIGSYLTNGSISSSPAIGTDGTVYVGSLDGKIYALTSDLSTVRGSYTTGGAIYSSPAIDGNGMVYVGSDDDRFYAFDSLLNLKWSYTTGGDVRCSPSIGSGSTTIYVSSYDDKLYAFRQSSIAYITVTPASATLSLQGTRSFTACAYDSGTRTILDATYTWQLASSEIGYITPSSGSYTLFTAYTKAMHSTLTVTSSSVTGTVPITVNPGSPTTMSYVSGNNQTGAVASPVTNPFVVKVTDAYNNVVSGVSVIFTITSIPAGAVGQYLHITSNVTDSNGEAKALLILGDTEGTYTTIGTNSTLSGSPVTFTAVGIPSATRLVFDPETKGVESGTYFNIDAKVEEVVSLKTAILYIRFDKDYIEVGSITKGAFLGGNPTISYNNTTGKIIYYVSTSTTTGVTGSGVLATIRFKALRNGTATISYSTAAPENTTLRNRYNNLIKFTKGTGTVIIGAGQITGGVSINLPPFPYMGTANLAGITVRDSFGTTTTTANGQFSFSNVLPGDYILYIQTKGAITETRTVTVAAGQITNVATITVYTGDCDENGRVWYDDDFPVLFDEVVAGTYNEACDANRNGELDLGDDGDIIWNNTPYPPTAPPIEDWWELTGTPTLTICTPKNIIEVGETFKVEIKVDKLAYLLLAEYYLTFDAQLLEVVDDDVIEDGIQVTPGTFPTGNFLRFHLLDKPGVVHYGLGMMCRKGADGGGVLSSITFRAKASGVVKLYFTPKTKFFDTGSRPIILETNSISIIIPGTPPPHLSTTLKDAYAYPNPSKIGEVKFDKLTPNTGIRIYNIVGELVYEREDFDDEPVWRCRNLSGEPVASGIYIYVLRNEQGEIKRGKIGVIR